LAIVCLIVEAVLLILFIPGVAYVEVLQHDGAGGTANALGFAITLVVIAVILVVASIIGFVRDRRSGFPLGLSIASIVIGAALAIGHAGIMIPGALN
jgi:hypothetical protein